MLDRTIAPPYGKISDFSLIEPKHTILPNGLPLFTISTGRQEVIRLEFITRIGSKHDLKPGLTFFTSKMLAEGTSMRTSSEIAAALDYLGVHVETNPGIDHTGISVYCLSKHLSEVLLIFKDVLLDPVFPEEELNTQKTIRKDGLKVNLEKNQFVASRKIRTCLFGMNHPYGRNLEVEHIDDISRNEILNFYKTAFFNEPLIIASGFVKEKEMDSIQKHLGHFPLMKGNFNTSSYEVDQVKNLTIEKPDSLQSSLRLGRLIPSKNHKDYLPLLVVNEIFGGYFGSRLMKNIREDKGYTYGVHSQVLNLEHASMQIIGADVKKEFSQATIDEIHKEMKKLKDELVSPNELETVKNYMLGSFLSSISTPFSLADKFKSIYFHNLDYNFYREYIENINSITSDQILETARSYFKTENYSTVVVG
ncbi:MAG: pitrilysin family protein [Bacteroidetes bacterium]|nr:pitrilysin family protein [Bacteroidota bacterium]MDA1119447.1 pitrilysin family protein [Bacteroidota bacterium]